MPDNTTTPQDDPNAGFVPAAGAQGEGAATGMSTATVNTESLSLKILVSDLYDTNAAGERIEASVNMVINARVNGKPYFGNLTAQGKATGDEAFELDLVLRPV